jgi:hypothetical protein
MIDGHRSYFSSDQDYIDYLDSGKNESPQCVYCGCFDSQEIPVTEIEVEYKGKIVKEFQCEICKNTKP